jgi:GWxTD domain-containing protein
MKISKKILIPIIIVLFLGACITIPNTISRKNISYIYNPASSQLHPNYLVYHQNDSVSTILIWFYPSELTFNKAVNRTTHSAKMRIKYKVFPSFESNKIIDSSSVNYIIPKNRVLNSFFVSIPIKIQASQTYALEVTATDILRNVSAKSYIPVDKTSKYTSQNYNVYSSKTNTIYFKNHFKPEESFRIRHNTKKSDSIYLSYYYYEFPLPPPPFSTMPRKIVKIKPDSIVRYKLNDKLIIKQKAASHYYFQIDTSERGGFSTYNFHKYFPFVKNSKQLLRPMRYLTSLKEYKRIEKSKNKKMEIDKFWLSAAGNTTRARELIRIYYNRVLFSNLYYTCYTEGWRTDRGMIYIIFGPPEAVYRTDLEERWVYGEGKSFRPVTFSFMKVENKFSDNIFILKRNPSFKSIWYKAIDTWRKGQVFYFDLN